jgi:pimeloyl-ACP methyl ester carboxylesterase
MLTVLSILFWLAVAAGALALLGYLFGRHYQLDLRPDSVVFVTTDDGWRLGLSRYRPAKPLEGAPPVVLCPGAGLNSTIFDVAEETSLARFLSGQGYDVWLLDLRGRGFPRGSGIWPRRRANWSFDDYLELDLPAALDAICRESGASQVQWVGFGLGGHLAYGALVGPDAHRLRSVIALGAPAYFGRQRYTFSPGLLRWLRQIRLDLTVRLLAPLLGRLYLPPMKRLQNRDNIDGLLYRRALVNAVSGLSRTELLQYAEWLEQDVFTAIVQRRDIRGAMSGIKTPVLLVTGPHDELAPADAMEATRDLLEGTQDKKLLIASRMAGMSTNYGHLDLLLGRGVRRDIFTHLLRWLDDHSGVEIPAGRPQPPPPRDGWQVEERPAGATPHQDTTREPPARVAIPAGAEKPDGLPEPDEPEDEADLVQGDVPRVPPL